MIEQFVDAIDGLSALSSVRTGPYLAVYRGLLTDGGDGQIVQLRTPADDISDPDETLSDTLQLRARRWGQAAAHPNVVDLVDAGATPRPWLLVADQPRTFAAARPEMTVREACAVVGDAAEALRNAALYNSSHGDLAPWNVAVTPDGTAAVDDWGVTRAVATHADGEHVTGYTAPEQLTDRTATAEATDVYGLGALAYFALTGRPPRDADRAAIRDGDPTPPSEVHDALPPAVDAPVLRALDDDPSVRHEGAYAFARAFEEAVAAVEDVDVFPSRERGPTGTVRDLPGVDTVTADALRAAGFAAVDQVATASESDLASVPGVDETMAERAKAVAERDGTDSADGSEMSDDPAAFDVSEGGDGIDEVLGDEPDGAGASANDPNAGGRTGADEPGGDDERPSAAVLEQRAEGNVTAEQLTDSASNTPLFEHLEPGEQPHYYFHNVNKGLKIERPDAEESETPYNVGYSHAGDRHLLVTDRRVLFVGGNEQGTDDVVSLPYEELVDWEANQGWTKERLTVEHVDGRRLSFYGVGQASHIDAAGDYVRRQIDRPPANEEPEDANAPSDGDPVVDSASGDTPGSDDLTAVSGVSGEPAERLRNAGYESVADLERASQSDLAEVVGNALGARITAALGAREGESVGPVTPDDGGTEPPTPSDAITGSGEPEWDRTGEDSRSPAEIAAAATGNLSASHLTDNETSTPLADHLGPGEQPHYYFHNVNKGLRFTHPDWAEKKTPYNVAYSHSGGRHLLVTDRRVLFVGGDESGTDTVVSFPYSDLVGVDANQGWTKGRLTVEHRDGRSVAFFDVSGQANHVEDAGEYVVERIERAEAVETDADSDANEDEEASGDPLGATADGTTDDGAADDDGGERDKPDGDGRDIETEPDHTGAESDHSGAERDESDGVESGGGDEPEPDESGPAGSEGGTDEGTTLAYCPSCGADLGQFDQRPNFCPSCGTDLSAY
mgnify:CR=1 FL=1